MCLIYVMKMLNDICEFKVLGKSLNDNLNQNVTEPDKIEGTDTHIR